MAEQKKTRQELLQAPFDYKYIIYEGGDLIYEDGEPLHDEDGEPILTERIETFPESVYEQRLDAVFGGRWNLEIDQDGNYKITAKWESHTVVRMGRSFKEACERFGVGRYLHLDGQPIPF